jgi:phosphatidylserine/phosphatidylglycerophosphate/cardiolipin synthase-like enzyme
VGSQNIDFLSSELNAEVGVFITDQSAIQKLLSIIDDWKKDTVVFDSNKYKLSRWDKVLAHFFNLFVKMI